MFGGIVDRTILVQVIEVPSAGMIREWRSQKGSTRSKSSCSMVLRYFLSVSGEGESVSFIPISLLVPQRKIQTVVIIHERSELEESKIFNYK